MSFNKRFFAKASELPTSSDYFRVPFEDAVSLIGTRSVFLKGGFAYVHKDDLISIACAHFRAHLTKTLMKTFRFLGAILKDTRMQTLILNLSKPENLDFQFEAHTKKLSGVISLADIDFYAQRAFPPCMKTLHGALRRDHHLKHFGRLQYVLFLKEVGLSLDDALRFFKGEFQKKIDGDKFEKQYAYNIRHSYGKEGKRQDYPAYSCTKIIREFTPGVGEYHGCPFKTFSEDALIKSMMSYGVSGDQLRNIIDERRENKF